MCCSDSDTVVDIDVEDEIKWKLQGSGADIDDGINLVHREFREAVYRDIRSRHDGVSSWDLDDAWQETLLGLLARVREGEFRNDGSLLALLKVICRRRIVDLLTAKRKLRKQLQRYREKVDLLGSAVDVGDVDPLTCDEIFHLICEKIDQLSDAQQRVWATFRDGGFLTEGYDELRQAVKEATGVDSPVNAIRRAYQEGEKKILEHLRRKGYMP
jgi:DNA-directed RNA polymerase specialized sigma24 family protein